MEVPVWNIINYREFILPYTNPFALCSLYKFNLQIIYFVKNFSLMIFKINFYEQPCILKKNYEVEFHVLHYK